MKLFYIYLLLLCFILIGPLVKADVRYVGNAGTGVLINEKPYLLDLYEVDTIDPIIDETIEPLSAYVLALSDLDILTPHEIRLLAIKLTEVREFAPSYADSLVVATNQYVWRLIETPLTLLPDASPVDVKNKLVQLANRYGPYVRISKKHWQELPSSNRVALILHEMISATLPLSKVPGQPLLFNQDIATVRNRVAYIFLPQFKARGAQAFLNTTGVEWQLSILLDKHTYAIVPYVLSWKVLESDSPLNIYAQFVMDNGLDIGFCSYVQEKTTEGKSLTAKFFYAAAVVSQTFISYNSTFGTQSALEETKPEYKDHLVLKMEFTNKNASSCLNLIEETTLRVFQIFNFQKIQKINQFSPRVRIDDNKLN